MSGGALKKSLISLDCQRVQPGQRGGGEKEEKEEREVVRGLRRRKDTGRDEKPGQENTESEKDADLAVKDRLQIGLRKQRSALGRT